MSKTTALHCTTTTSFLHVNMDKALKISTLGNVAYIWRIERFQIDAIKFERTQTPFRRFFLVHFSHFSFAVTALLDRDVLISGFKARKQRSKQTTTIFFSFFNLDMAQFNSKGVRLPLTKWTSSNNRDKIFREHEFSRHVFTTVGISKVTDILNIYNKVNEHVKHSTSQLVWFYCLTYFYFKGKI